MKFSIRGLIFLTLLAAVIANAATQLRRVENAKAEIMELERKLDYEPFDAAYVDAHTRVCELAIANNPLPSRYYLAAKVRQRQLAATKTEMGR
ncbi:MAG: hypothetical protein WBD20_13720 [Pirellulaceae bacterium]